MSLSSYHSTQPHIIARYLLCVLSSVQPLQPVTITRHCFSQSFYGDLHHVFNVLPHPWVSWFWMKMPSIRRMVFDEGDIIICTMPDVMIEPWNRDVISSSFSTVSPFHYLLIWIELIWTEHITFHMQQALLNHHHIKWRIATLNQSFRTGDAYVDCLPMPPRLHKPFKILSA